MEELQKAIEKMSQKYQIDPMKLRINISKPEFVITNNIKQKNKDLRYHIMEYKTVIEETNLATALNLTIPSAFFANIKLNSVFDKLSADNQIPKTSMNVKIYTESEDYSPKIYLFDGENPKRKVALEEIN